MTTPPADDTYRLSFALSALGLATAVLATFIGSVWAVTGL